MHGGLCHGWHVAQVEFARTFKHGEDRRRLHRHARRDAHGQLEQPPQQQRRRAQPQRQQHRRLRGPAQEAAKTGVPWWRPGPGGGGGEGSSSRGGGDGDGCGGLHRPVFPLLLLLRWRLVRWWWWRRRRDAKDMGGRGVEAVEQRGEGLRGRQEEGQGQAADGQGVEVVLDAEA